MLWEKLIRQFVSPAETSGLLQMLDQINAALHRGYNLAKTEMRRLFTLGHMNREIFMLVLGNMWGT